LSRALGTRTFEEVNYEQEGSWAQKPNTSRILMEAGDIINDIILKLPKIQTVA